MLGAQARAAELQAAKSAAIRQKAHREAEDRSLPPEFTPVSLTDFTRNPLITRNKGPKAFRPLVDSDLENLDAPTEPSGPGEETDSTDCPRTSLIESAPAAPRAMLRQHDWTAPRMTSFSAQASNFNYRLQDTSMLVKSYNSYNGITPPTCSERVTDFWTERPSTPPCVDSMSSTRGYVFGPDDLSPTKQEQKFMEMRQQHGSIQNVQQPYGQFSKSFKPTTSTYSPRQYKQRQTQIQYPEMFVNWSSGLCVGDRPVIRPHQSESGTSSAVYNQTHNHDERMRSFTNDLVDHQQKAISRMQIPEMFEVSPSTLNNDLPYDRDSKMQSFVAAQQAMARRGKTVLHNPDLHRSPRDRKQISPNLDMTIHATTNIEWKHPSVCEKKKTKQFGTSGTGTAEDMSEKQAVLYPNLPCKMVHGNLATDTPALENESFATPTTFEQCKPVTMSAMSSLDEWCILRPITMSERQEMISFRRRIANEASPNSGVYSATISSPIVGAKAREWLQTSCISRSSKQCAVEKVIDECEKHHVQNVTYGIIGKPVTSDDLIRSNRVASNAVAEIMATLSEHAEERRNGYDIYTPLPAHSLCATNAVSSSSNSMFDDLGFCIRQSTETFSVRPGWE